MTTIAYDGKTVACDGRATNANGRIVTNTIKKYLETEDGVIFFAGLVTDVEPLASIINERSSEDLCEASLLLVDRKGVMAVEQDETGKVHRLELDEIECFAIGSGADFAVAAMDMGMSAKEAVAYAMQRDCYSGGKVSVFDIESMSFVE